MPFGPITGNVIEDPTHEPKDTNKEELKQLLISNLTISAEVDGITTDIVIYFDGEEISRIQVYT